jgi:Ca2+-binding EF-hand superfamily protein
MTMKPISTRFVCLVACTIQLGCGSLNMHQGAPDWDLNDNSKLTQAEFVAGYQKSRFFNQWDRSKNYITSDQFISGLFDRFDTDGNHSISANEYKTRIHRYISGQQMPDFSTADLDKSDDLKENEFQEAMTVANIVEEWDMSHDGKVSDDEMAKGVFHRCDLDNNGMLNTLEFNIWIVNR